MRPPNFLLIPLIATMIVATPFYGYALTPEEEALEAAMPSGDNLERLKETIAADPENLDHYFSYAMLAKRLKKYDRAAWALENMLNQNGNLQRVKLELGLVYIELERFDEARELFNEVLATSPPQEVRGNIETILAALDERTKTHHLKATLLAGMNSDSNANSAPSSGNVTVVDTTIPLGAGAGATQDFHKFAAISLDHSYDIDVSRMRPSWRWKSAALAYHTDQHTLDNLNIQLYSIKAGPEVTLNDIPIQARAAAGYQLIKLDGHSYLRNPKAEANIDFMAEPNLIFNYNYMWEFRNYVNSPTNTTYRDRTGRAFQHTFGVRHILSPKAILAYSLMLRNENARELYYANKQAGANASFTYAFTEQAFMSLSAGYKKSSYVIPDLLVSVNDRRDTEKSVGINAGYRFESNYTGDFVVSGGYQYRDVSSTIQNYDYDNHRFTVSLAKEFEN